MPINGSCSRFKKLMKENISQETSKQKEFVRFAPFPISLVDRFKDFRDLLNRVPITVSCRNAKEFFDFAEVTDRFHLSSIKTQNESVLDRDDLEQPLVM